MKLVWIPHPQDAWVVAQVVSSDAKSVTVRTRHGGEQQVPGALSTLDMVTPEALETNYGNLVDMEDFNEGIILHQVRQRYQRGSIYTFVGSILVAVNPYKSLSIYGVDVMQTVRQISRSGGALPPHVFSVLATAFDRMLQENYNQTILISGESGAGKTETTKLVLQYLSSMAGSTSSRGSLTVEKQLLDSNPLLESFGNAKTVRNNNSSRFGKFMEVNFNERFHIKGCNVTTYLLEKSRVVNQAQTERNFHSFYMLLAGASKAMRHELDLRPPEQFHYLACSGCVDIPHRSDERMFHELEEAMLDMRIEVSAQRQIFGVLAGILHLGNIAFHPSREVEGGSQVASMADLKRVAGLLGIGAAGLAKSLCSKEASFQAGEKISIPLDPSKACDQRDTLAKHAYSKLFDYIVFRLNNVLFRGRVGRSIGILDIFGFEVFPKNLFEQLCINYCNERLQYFFNEVMFQSELEVYRQEGIECEGIAFQDNLGCVRLIDSRNPVGIFSMLDEEGVMPRSSDAKFIARVHSHFDENKTTKSAYYARNRRRPDEFSIRHFAGEVTYCSDGFIEKNKDSMSGNILSELEAGSLEFLRESFHASSGTAPSSPPSKATTAHVDSAGTSATKLTLSAKFKADLDSLMATLKTTAPHFIRCIKPNDKQVPDAFDPMLTLRQMKYAGLFEAIRIRKAGYLIRVSHAQFIQRYKHCCPEVMSAMRSARESNPRNICAAMLESMLLKVGNGSGVDFSWAIGASRVFLKSMKLRLALEQLRTTSVDSVAAQIQKVVRGFLVRCKLSKARLQMLERKRQQREREQEESRRMGVEDARCALVEEAFRSDLSERRKIEEARQLRLKIEREKKLKHWNMSATLIQKRVRGMIARIRWSIKKAEFYLERAILSRSERLLEEAIVLTESMKSKPKKIKDICANAKILLVTVQGEVFVKSQLEDAMATQNDELISSAIRLAEDAGMTYLEEYSRGKQALDREVRRRAVLSHIQGALDRCGSIPSLIKHADKLEGLVLTATNLGLSGEVLVQDATGRLRRVQSLLRVRDNIRVAVELCSVSMMKEAMRERHKLLPIYGPQFCEDEARAVLRLIQMFSHETHIAPGTDPELPRGSDAEGSENTSSFHPPPRNDVRLPPFVRQELDRIRDAKTASELESATSKFLLLVPNEKDRLVYQRVHKWVVSFATWRYDVSADVVKGTGFVKDALYFGAFGHTEHEPMTGSLPASPSSSPASPMRRPRAVSTSPGVSFGPVTGPFTPSKSPNRNGSTSSSPTKHRYSSKDSVSSIAETNATQGPSYIPFSQRQSKSDVAAAAALKALKSKKKDSSEFAADSSVSKSEVVQRSVTFAGSSTQRSRDLQAMAAIANSSSSSSAGPARHSPAEGKAEKALREAMKDYERFVNKHGSPKLNSWKR